MTKQEWEEQGKDKYYQYLYSRDHQERKELAAFVDYGIFLFGKPPWLIWDEAEELQRWVRAFNVIFDDGSKDVGEEEDV